MEDENGCMIVIGVLALWSIICFIAWLLFTASAPHAYTSTDTTKPVTISEGYVFENKQPMVATIYAEAEFHFNIDGTAIDSQQIQAPAGWEGEAYYQAGPVTLTPFQWDNRADFDINLDLSKNQTGQFEYTVKPLQYLVDSYKDTVNGWALGIWIGVPLIILGLAVGGGDFIAAVVDSF